MDNRRTQKLVSATDREIIRLLQLDARASFAEISRVTGIPESTVRRRVDRLQELGVITFSMVADPSRLGFNLRATVGLRVDLHELEGIAQTLIDTPEVTFAAFLTGNYDILVQVVVKSQEALVNFLRSIADIPGVRSTETYVMPWIIKPTTSWVLPVDDSEIEEEEFAPIPARGQRRRG